METEGWMRGLKFMTSKFPLTLKSWDWLLPHCLPGWPAGDPGGDHASFTCVSHAEMLEGPRCPSRWPNLPICLKKDSPSSSCREAPGRLCCVVLDLPGWAQGTCGHALPGHLLRGSLAALPKTVTPPHSPAASSLSDTACYPAPSREGRGLCWVRGCLGQCGGTERAQDTLAQPRRRCGVYLMKWRGLSAPLLTSCAVLAQLPNLSDPRFLHPGYRTPRSRQKDQASTVTRGTVPTQ